MIRFLLPAAVLFAFALFVPSADASWGRSADRYLADVIAAERELRAAEHDLSNARCVLEEARQSARRDIGRRELLERELRAAERARDEADRCVVEADRSLRQFEDELRHLRTDGRRGEILRSELRREQERVLSFVRRSQRWQQVAADLDRAEADLERERRGYCDRHTLNYLENAVADLRRELGAIEADALRQDRRLRDLERQLQDVADCRSEALILADIEGADRVARQCDRDAADAHRVAERAASALAACPAVDLARYEHNVRRAEANYETARCRLEEARTALARSDTHRGRDYGRRDYGERGDRPRDRYRRGG